MLRRFNDLGFDIELMGVIAKPGGQRNAGSQREGAPQSCTIETQTEHLDEQDSLSLSSASSGQQSTTVSNAYHFDRSASVSPLLAPQPSAGLFQNLGKKEPNENAKPEDASKKAPASGINLFAKDGGDAQKENP